MKATIINEVIICKADNNCMVASITNEMIVASITGDATVYIFDAYDITPPEHFNSNGIIGHYSVDDDYIYFCIGIDRWIKLPGFKNF